MTEEKDDMVKEITDIVMPIRKRRVMTEKEIRVVDAIKMCQNRYEKQIAELKDENERLKIENKEHPIDCIKFTEQLWRTKIEKDMSSKEMIELADGFVDDYNKGYIDQLSMVNGLLTHIMLRLLGSEKSKEVLK